MKTINIHEAKTQLSRLVQEALEGEEIVIARRNVPLVKLVAIPSARPRRSLGSLRGRIHLEPDFDETPEDLADYT